MPLSRDEAEVQRSLRLLTAAGFNAVTAQGGGEVERAVSRLEQAAGSAVGAYATPGEVLAAFESGVVEGLDVAEQRASAFATVASITGTDLSEAGGYADAGEVMAAYERGCADALAGQQRRRSALDYALAIVAEREAARHQEAA